MVGADVCGGHTQIPWHVVPQAAIRELFSAGGAPLPEAASRLFILDYSVRVALCCMHTGSRPHTTRSSAPPSLLAASTLQALADASRTLDRSKHYVPAPICILELQEPSPGGATAAAGGGGGSGGSRLRPVAILCDKTQPGVPVAVAAADSPQWRFAKQCVRVADFTLHELGSHLTLCHFLSETVALATYRCLPKAHPVYQLLAPHFYKVRGSFEEGRGELRFIICSRRFIQGAGVIGGWEESGGCPALLPPPPQTLPINANARASMIPRILVGLGATPLSEQQWWKTTMDIHRAWDFASHYAPADLAARGVADLPPQVYPFAATATAAWGATRAHVARFVARASAVVAGGDGGSSSGAAPSPLIARDERLAAWVAQLRDPAWLPSFPDIRDDEALVDA